MNSTLYFTLIQSDLHWENKKENRNQFQEKIQSISGNKQIVILPETFNTGFSMNNALSEPMNSETLQWMTSTSKENRVILCGSFFVQENNQFFNRLVWMQPNGQFGFYDKRHLFSFSKENESYSPGDKKFFAQVNGWKISTIICYDLRFPVWIRQTQNERYDVLVCIANWPAKRSHAWRTLLQARAIENQCYVVAVNRVGTDGNGLDYQGNSCVIGPLGEIIFDASNEETIHTLPLDKGYLESIRSQFQFLNDADDFAI
ncbi:MAG TPA: nitrilase family protein [Chitinophagaceae bacterium]|nr:nitrilase family protein [Chitinophagaceae bacterium]